MDVRIGWAAFDAAAAPMDVRVGWAEFDATASPFGVFVGWAEFDVRSPNGEPVPPYRPGGGVGRYHASYNPGGYPAAAKYDVLVDSGEDEEEETIMAILMEISAHVL